MNLNISFKEKSMRATGFGEVIRVSSTENDYNKLENKPSINEVVLIGNRTSDELNLQDHMDAISNSELAALLV